MIADICGEFRELGVPTRLPKTIRHGMSWPQPYLSKLLADEAYHTGERTFGGEIVQYPPIFSAELWTGIVARRAKNAHHAKRNTKVDYLLQHVIFCRCCKLGFSSSTKRYQYGWKKKDGCERKRYDIAAPKRSYRCVWMAEYHYKCRPVTALNADETEALVWGTLA